jgi:hypothetical protein
MTLRSLRLRFSRKEGILKTRFSRLLGLACLLKQLDVEGAGKRMIAE